MYWIELHDVHACTLTRRMLIPQTKTWWEEREDKELSPAWRE